MKKEGTTNKSMIFIGVLIIAAISLTIVLIGNREPKHRVMEDNFAPIEGAVAGSFDTPEELWGEKEYDSLIGSDKAKLKVLVYEDYSNPYSAELAKTLNLLSGEYKNDIAIISRPFVASNSTDSYNLSLGYLCAKDVGKGSEMRSILLKQAGEEIVSFDLPSYVRELKLDEEKFETCMDSQEKLVVIDELKDDAKSNMVLGSPTILIDKEMIIGARPYADFVDSNGDAIEGLKTVVKRHLSSVK